MKIRFCFYLLITSMLSFAQPVNQVKINLTLDQSFYFSGQEMNLFYQIVNPSNNKIIETVEVVYIILKNSNSNNIIEQKVLAKNGIGEMSIKIPKSIESGMYELIVYTNYLQNVGADAFFRRRVAIYNSEEIFESNEENMQSTFDFYPEGGQLVLGLSNRLVYKHSGLCKIKSANLVDDKDRVVLEFNLSETGIGSLFFKPEKNKEYKVKHACDTLNTVSYHLPEARAEGLTLNMTQRNKKTQIVVRSNTQSYKRDSVKIMGFAHNKKVYESKGLIRKGSLFAEVQNSELPFGTMAFFVASIDDSVLANRSIFVNKERQLDSLIVDLQGTLFSTKEKVALKVSSISNKAIVSVYVIDENDYNIRTNRIIDDVLSDANRIFAGITFSQNQLKLIDDLLIIKASNSRMIPKIFLPERIYPREHFSYIRGELSDLKALPDSTELSFFIPEVNMVYQAMVDSSGKFEFPIFFEFHDERDILFYPRSANHVFSQPTITHSDFKVETKLELNEPLQWTDLHERERGDFLRKEKFDEVFNFYESTIIEGTSEATSWNIDKMLPDADAIYILDEYLSFPTMEETIKEIISGLWVRERNGKKAIRMFYKNWMKEFAPDLASKFNSTPFILINNQPADVDDLLSLDPSDIDKIQLISDYQKLAELIPFGSGGIVTVSLKESAEITNRKKALYFSYKGIASKPSSSKATNTTNTIPDMRTVLMWAGNKEIGNDQKLEMSFMTSDRPGNYIVIVKSIGDNGELGYTTKKISVDFKGVN